MASTKSCFELRAAMDKMWLRQTTLAKMCGVNAQQVWRWRDGSAPVPMYVWTILALLDGADKWDVKRGKLPEWHVNAGHVYRGKSYKQMAKRFHPDVAHRDTTAEMQLINRFRDST